jgi:hypothetical protein
MRKERSTPLLTGETMYIETSYIYNRQTGQ